MITALAYSADYGYMGYGLGSMYYSLMSPGYLFVIIGLIITLLASANVNRTFAKYDKIRSARGITGAEAARRILDANGIHNIRIERVNGKLSDHFSPAENVIRLSDSTFNSTSIAAIGVAAHECGHAVQHQVGYVPIKVRNSIVKPVNICNTLSLPIIMIGLILGYSKFAMFGVILFSAVLIFQLVTLPTETNASSRAMKTLEDMRILEGSELAGARKVLTAAAMTYFASAASTALQLLRLFMIVSNNNRRRN